MRGRGLCRRRWTRTIGRTACGVPRLPASAWTEGRRRPPLPRGAAFLHCRERSLARVAGALRSLEQRVEALRSLEQGWRLRGVLRHSGIHEFDGASHSDVQLNHRARACVGSRAKGSTRPGARPLARRLRHQDPRKIGRLRRHHRLRSDRRRSFRRASLRNPARHRTRHPASRRHLRQGLRQQGQPRGGKGARRRAGHPAQGQRKRQADFFARTLYKARARIEQGVGRLKRFKRVALRCEKTARNFRSIVAFAAGLCLIKFVHTA